MLFRSVNGSGEVITNGSLEDIIPDGLGEPEDFIVRELSYDLDGNETVGGPIDFTTPVLTDDGFTMSFDSIAARSGYRVKYTTPIENYDISEFTNEATFESDQVDLEAKATVDGLERSNPIQKSGEVHYWAEDYPYNHIEWKIIVNENGMNIDGAIVHDDLPEGVTLVPESISIEKNDVNVTNDYDVSQGFPIKLDEVSRDEIYTITFVTKVNWGNVNDGNFQRENFFVNTSRLTDGDEELGEDSAEVTFWRVQLVEKSGDAEDYDYEDKTLSWQIIINRAGHPIDDAVLTDTIPAGLDISVEDIVIEGADVEPSTISITENENGTQTVRIPLGSIDSMVSINYSTRVENFDINSFRNEATDRKSVV